MTTTATTSAVPALPTDGVIPIALDRLIPGKANVRRAGAKDGIEALAASIAAHGLRQNLNAVAVEGSDRFEVVAGGRRLRALKLLVKQKRLAKDAPIPCRVLATGEDAGEISLAENILRTAMHPLDEFEAFDRLAREQHLPAEDIAARFGVTALCVTQRLRLARVSPVLRALYRREKMTLQQLMAFTLSDDHAEQERVWKDLPDHSRQPGTIRQALAGEAVSHTHRLARFVGLDAYEAAGGTLLRDLFTAGEGGYLSDFPLLLRLAGERLEAEAERFKAEGWAWVKTGIDYDHSARYDWLEAPPNADEDDDTWQYAPEDMARAGVVLAVTYQGALDVTLGCIERVEEPAPDDTDTGTKAGAAPAKADPTALNGTLVADLTAHRTAALRSELANHPDMALAAVVHALALDLFYEYHSGTESCLALRTSSERLAAHVKTGEESPAHAALAEQEKQWRVMLPEHPAELFGFCLGLGQTVLLDLLATLAALSVNAVQEKYDRPTAPRLAHADALADALGLDMRAHWTPTAEGFFSRLSKAQLVQAVNEAKAPLQVNFGSLKKHEAARHVAKAMHGTGWLPAPLRRGAPVTATVEAA